MSHRNITFGGLGRNMGKGIFTDSKKKPDARSIEQAVGSAGINWSTLTEHLTSELKIKGELKFYGVNYGWAVRYSKSGKSVIALYPNMDGFTAQIILNNSQVRAALQRSLASRTKETIRNTPAIHEGKWIYLDVDKKTDIKEIEMLVSVRLKVK